MHVGILIISHAGIGAAMLGTAQYMMKESPLDIKIITVNRDSEYDDLMTRTKEMISDLDTGSGVLILTDLYGSTPSNIAYKLAEESNIKVVSGINLSMLLRVFNYPELELEQLAEKAHTGGIDGIVINKKEKE